MSFLADSVRVEADLIETRGISMARLPKFTLSHNEQKKKWELAHAGSGEVVKRFATKAAATKGGVLEKAVGKLGSVKIKKRNGRVQEERTFPRSMDPRSSKG
jgi:Uncharacterized protein conserved in bacteria (DUF2188)